MSVQDSVEDEASLENDFVASSIPEIETEEEHIYLSGPIRYVDDAGADWRQELIEEYGDEYEFINPLDSYDPREVEILNSVAEMEPESDKEQVPPVDYVTEDKCNLNKADFVFVGLPEVISRGTVSEIMYCHFIDTPVFVWEMDGQTESGWIRFHSEFVNDDRDLVMDTIDNYE